MERLKKILLSIVLITISYPLLWRLIAYSNKKIMDRGNGEREERTEIIHILPYIELGDAHPPFNSHMIFYEYFRGNMPIERGGYVLKNFYSDEIVKHGEWIEWGAMSGKVYSLGSYSNGKREGTWFIGGYNYFYKDDKEGPQLGDAHDIYRE